MRRQVPTTRDVRDCDLCLSRECSTEDSLRIVTRHMYLMFYDSDGKHPVPAHQQMHKLTGTSGPLRSLDLCATCAASVEAVIIGRLGVNEPPVMLNEKDTLRQVVPGAAYKHITSEAYKEST